MDASYHGLQRIEQGEEDRLADKLEEARAAKDKAEQLQARLEEDGARLKRAQHAIEAERAQLQVWAPGLNLCFFLPFPALLAGLFHQPPSVSFL